MNRKDYDGAEALLRRCIAVVPGSAEVHHRLGFLKLQRGDAAGAYEHYKVAAGKLTDSVDVWFQFALCLETLRTFDAALIALNKAMEIGPATCDMYATLGRVHHALGNSDEAIRAYDAVLVMRPGNFEAAYQRANEMQMKGDFASARDAYLEALKLRPDMVEVHFRLAEMGHVAGHEDEIVSGLVAAAEAPEASTQRRATAFFGAARIRRREGRHDEAFDCYCRANAAFRAEHAFDRAVLDEMIETRLAAFGPAAFEAHGDGVSDSRQPIFIVGMPRSGSTLVEQILSSHPDVAAAGEFRKLHEIDTALAGQEGDARYRYPADLAVMPRGSLAPVAANYLEALETLCGPGHARITDKFLFNFFHLGLIAILFPKATVVRCRRDARDIALSCFFQNFSSHGGLAFTYDLGDIGYYIRQYDRLMAHWRSVLPIAVFDIDYEELVGNQEAASRALVAHAGLDWDDACLRPHENTRSVKTASFWQVRQPVYSSSVGVWRDYEAHLGPLLAELGKS
jgi:predicted TPR repeat methyltransferase